MKQKIVRRASALVLAGCLLAGAALPALAASAKEEVIYANLDASGTVTGVYAVNSFAVQAGDTVTDHGSYTAVRNMTTTDPLKHSGDTVTATVAEDGKLYYEGTMDTATALPWLVKLTYMLDGAEIAPEELGGKSGALAIRLQVSRNPACTGDFFDQYALQVTMTLDTDRAQNIVADGATMANVGSNKQLSYILLPGSDSDVTVTADVTDFAMNAISLNGVKLRLNLDLDGADLTGMLDRLQGGSVQLDDGANALADGIAQVQAGLDTLNGKSGELTGGSAKVKAALTQMQTALNGVSAEVKRGEFVAVLGANGCGKSTLAKHFNAILLPESGTVLVEGMDTKDEDKIYDIRQTVGMVFQSPDNQIVATVVEEDVAFALENLGVPPEEMRRRVDEAMKMAGIYEYRERAPHNLSGGQKQRVAIAGVVAMRPDCLILDEATAMLDPRGREQVMQTIHHLNKNMGITVVSITHYMEEAAQADRVLVMSKGNVVMEGTPKEVFSQTEKVRALRLDVPQAAELRDELVKAGIPMPEGIIDTGACAQALYELLK